MAAFTEGGSEGSLNGTSVVTLVSSPGSSVRRLVRAVTVANCDTAAVTVTVRKVKSATSYQIAKVTLQVGDTLVLDEVQVLDATDESVTALMSGAAATTNPTYTAAYGDAS